MYIDTRRSALFERLRDDDDWGQIRLALCTLGVDFDNEREEQVAALRELIYFLQAMQFRIEAQDAWMKNREERKARKEQEEANV
jgi:hypothetical protein